MDGVKSIYYMIYISVSYSIARQHIQNKQLDVNIQYRRECKEAKLNMLIYIYIYIY